MAVCKSTWNPRHLFKILNPVLYVASGGKKKDRDSRSWLTKADIGPPKDFCHVSYVDWDTNKGFDLEDADDHS
jgi:hypothetical protein